MPNGKIQPEFTDTLAIVGTWMQKNGESIYGTRGNVIAPQQWGVVTAKNKTLYAHIMSMPQQPYIFLPQVRGKVTKAVLMSDGSSVRFKQMPEGVFVYTSSLKADPDDTIIQLTTN
jgi:alpha-L-fucosidase